MDFLPSYGFAFSKKQIVLIIYIPASEPANVDIVIFDSYMTKPSLFWVQSSDVFAVLLFCIVAYADFYEISYM